MACEITKRFESVDLAKAAIEKSREFSNRQRAAYYCPECNAWHIRVKRVRAKQKPERSTFTFTPPPAKGELHIRDFTSHKPT